MLTKDDFSELLNDAYRHLYDLVYLRSHPLLDVLVPHDSQPSKQRAWQCHHLLLSAVEEIAPAPPVDVASRQWRRHQVMVLRYVQDLDPDAASERLAISKRQFYREHKVALEAIADILWERHIAAAPEPETPLPADPDRLTLLRLEAARIAQSGRLAQIGDVLEGVLPFLQELRQQRDLKIDLRLREALPQVAIERALLRQLLLSVLGCLAGNTEDGTLAIASSSARETVELSVCVEPSTALADACDTTLEDRLATLNEMASVSDARVTLLCDGDVVCGYTLHLPVAERIVLSVDDNEDILALIQRYLRAPRYRVVTAQTAADALEKAERLKPHVITLDLMMPRQDGWDLLQTLLHRPATSHIPIVVCSVLRQRELVLSLGASAFLEKPVTEDALLTTLAALGLGE